jgi:hypothetical protein
MAKLKLKGGQDVWLTETWDMTVHHATVVHGKERPTHQYYLIQFDDGHQRMMADDYAQCFTSQKLAYDFLLRISKFNVREARDMWQQRRCEYMRLKQRKKEALKQKRKKWPLDLPCPLGAGLVCENEEHGNCSHCARMEESKHGEAAT